MKKAAGVARCGLFGKIDCQCNNNTLGPDNVEAAARRSSGGVLISVPRSGTSCMLQAGDSSSNSRSPRGQLRRPLFSLPGASVQRPHDAMRAIIAGPRYARRPAFAGPAVGSGPQSEARAVRPLGLPELMFLRSTPGRRGNLLIPITAPRNQIGLRRFVIWGVTLYRRRIHVRLQLTCGRDTSR